MRPSKLLTASILPILAFSTPAPQYAARVSLPAAVPDPIASQAASAIANLPIPIPISTTITTPTAIPTSVPSTGGESSEPTDLVPHLGISPSILLTNIEAAMEILEDVKSLLDPEMEISDDIMLPPGQLGGGEEEEINGQLVTILVNLATDMLSLAPGGAPGLDQGWGA